MKLQRNFILKVPVLCLREAKLTDNLIIKGAKSQMVSKSKLRTLITVMTFSSSFLLLCNLSQAATVTGTFMTSRRMGGRPPKTLNFLNTYGYNTKLSVKDTSRPAVTVWSIVNDGSSPIPKVTQDTREVSISVGTNWNLPINLSFQDKYMASNTETYTIAPKTKGRLIFEWIGDEILPGGTIKTQQKDSSGNTFGPITTSSIGSGFYSYTGQYVFKETPVPEPLTILGSATALGFGALLKREYAKKQNKS